MNKLYIIGNLTNDPELRTTPNGVSVCTMTVAVNRRFASANGERQTDFFRVTAWRQLGENCARFLTKGRKVAVVGEVTARAYESKDGSGPRASLEVTADEIEFLTPKDQYQAQGYQSGQSGYRQSYPQQGGQNNQKQSGSWQDNSARNDGGNQNPFSAGDGQGMGFEEISDSDLPF